jgi:hypothetical protein
MAPNVVALMRLPAVLEQEIDYVISKGYQITPTKAIAPK